MTQPIKQYLRDLSLVMIAYTICVFGINLMNTEGMGPIARIVLSMIPMIPASLMVAVIVRYVRQIDEVQRRIITESCLASLVVVGLATFTYGFLEGAVSLPEVSLIWIFPALIGTAGISQIFVRMTLR